MSGTQDALELDLLRAQTPLLIAERNHFKAEAESQGSQIAALEAWRGKVNEIVNGHDHPPVKGVGAVTRCLLCDIFAIPLEGKAEPDNAPVGEPLADQTPARRPVDSETRLCACWHPQHPAGKCPSCASCSSGFDDPPRIVVSPR